MKLIDVSTKKFPNTFTMVDDEDYEEHNQWKWQYSGSECRKFYVRRTIHTPNKKYAVKKLHREIMKPKGLETIDHINGDTLDNRKCNLRICSRAENSMNLNKCKRKTSSIYKGVHWNRQKSKWKSVINKDRKVHHIGFFNNEKEGALAYNEKAKELFGEFARLNIIREKPNE